MLHIPCDGAIYLNKNVCIKSIFNLRKLATTFNTKFGIEPFPSKIENHENDKKQKIKKNTSKDLSKSPTDKKGGSGG